MAYCIYKNKTIEMVPLRQSNSLLIKMQMQPFNKVKFVYIVTVWLTNKYVTGQICYWQFFFYKVGIGQEALGSSTEKKNAAGHL